MAAFLYKWIHKDTGMWYIGSRTGRNCSVDDGYICSSTLVKPLIIEDASQWTREILVIGEAKYIRKLETDYLAKIDAAADLNSFNKVNTNFNNHEKTSIEGKIRIHRNDKNKFIFPAEFVIFEQYGWKLGMSESTKNKMKENHANVSGENNPMHGVSRIGYWKGKTMTDEQKKNKRKPKTVEHRKKLSEAKAGKNNPMYGKKQSPETCEKRSIALKGRVPWNKGLKKCDSLNNSASPETIKRFINELKI